MNPILLGCGLAAISVGASEVPERSVAGTPEHLAETEANRDDSQPGTPAGLRTQLSNHGFDYSVTYIGEVLANVSGGLKRGVVYEGLLRVDVDLDTEKLGVWRNGNFHASMLYPHGDGLSEEHIGDLFALSNIDAPASPRLFELWYEHQLLPDRLSLRIGQLAADEEFAGTDTGSVFINGTFGWPAVISANVPAPAYPMSTPGVRLAADLGRGWAFQTALYNGEPCPTDENGNDLNPHGVYYKFQDALLLSELKKDWSLGETETALPGSAKLGGWYHTGPFEHQRLDESGVSLADPSSTGRPLQVRGNWGFYLAIEQMLWWEGPDTSEQGLRSFTRVGGSPDDRNLIPLYADAGLTYTGIWPGRDTDVLGIAVAYAHLSREARQLVIECNRYSSLSTPLPDHEMLVEATYQVAIHSKVTAQPVLAWIIQPGGSPGADALALGLRFQMDF